MTQATDIRRILSGIGWLVLVPEFEEPYELVPYEICQLIGDTKDGFPDTAGQVQYATGPDPPDFDESSDSPHWADSSDPPHWLSYEAKIHNSLLPSKVLSCPVKGEVLYRGSLSEVVGREDNPVGRVVLFCEVFCRL